MVNEYCAQGLSLHLGKRQIIDNVSVALRAFVGFPHLPISVIMSHPCDNDDNYKIAAISNQGSG